MCSRTLSLNGTTGSYILPRSLADTALNGEPGTGPSAQGLLTAEELCSQRQPVHLIRCQE